MTAVKKYYYNDLKKLVSFVSADLNLVNIIGEFADIQYELSKQRRLANSKSKLLIVYFNHLWEPILKLATRLGWRRRDSEQNWLDDLDVINLCNLSGWELVSKGKRLLLPIYIPLISDIINRWIANLPIINNLCLVTWVVVRPKQDKVKEYSVSIIVPTRNEAGNIKGIVMSIPKFGKNQEIIFVEGGSSDHTWEEITKNLKKSKNQKIKIRAFKQKGRGKGDAVRLGFSKARGDVLMILDADLTVAASELPKFYRVLSNGLGEFANGSRLVYPMERQAMRLLNKAGNKLFGWMFTYILGQRFKDTLCGTKVLFRNDYLKIAKGRTFFGNFDPFGDFDLIFGAVKNNLKVIEVPIRYRERTYGSTNISRFRHGWLLLKMTWFAYRKFRLW